ncbi:MAG: cytidylate kinase family protein [Erysipelotrichaceae bacterium]|nr:cytidylate kinase family protein [Erysipelotrichaceae bacterium]
MKNKMNMSDLIRRSLLLVTGLFILSCGIALSARSGLGVSPSASLAYVLSQIFPLSMGNFNTLINVVFVVIQIVLLGKAFKPTRFLQLLAVVIFGFFIDFANTLFASVTPANYAMAVIMAVVACALDGIGVFFEVKANLLTMASEGAISVISQKINQEFGKVKIMVDFIMIAMTTVISLVVFHKLEAVREGTILAAVLVGFFVGVFSRILNKPVDAFLGIRTRKAAVPAEEIPSMPHVITIERELGSGGHRIGEILAEKLGYAFYDYALLTETAAKMGLTVDEVSKVEERNSNSLLYSLYQQSYVYSQNPSRQQKVFDAQSQIIREIAAKENCVIVGRLGAYVLKDRPHTFDLFVSAKLEERAKRFAQQNGMGEKEALEYVRREDEFRKNYSLQITGETWGMAQHYDLCVRTDEIGIEESAEMALKMIRDVLDKRAA